MLRKLLFGIAVLAAICHTAVHAQSISRKMTRGFDLPDSVLNGGKMTCGSTSGYIASLGIAPPLSGGPMGLVISVGYPPGAIDTCGHFAVYYEDIATSLPGGFNATGGVGINRKSVLCAVLSYIQSVYDFSAIPAGQYIRLQVAPSYDAGNPAPPGTTDCIWGAPYYNLVRGVTNGFVQQYATTGTDPKPSYFHAQIKVNFDRVYITPAGTPVNYYESTGTSISNCQYDLYSALTHAVTHTLSGIP